MIRSRLIRTPFILLSFFSLLFLLSINTTAQDRERVVDDKTKKTEKTKSQKSKPATTRKVTILRSSTNTGKRPALTNDVTIVNSAKKKPLVKKTASSKPTDEVRSGSPYAYSATTRALMMQSIRAKLGLRYRYGTQGPRSYDCSGFVWKVFQESGIPFTRTSARWFWKSYKPVYGKDRFEFGTLVFFNRLGHVGIVVDEKGFYHASRSKGVTYSPFKGYWSKRIVGYRRIPTYAY